MLIKQLLNILKVVVYTNIVCFQTILTENTNVQEPQLSPNFVVLTMNSQKLSQVLFLIEAIQNTHDMSIDDILHTITNEN